MSIESVPGVPGSTALPQPLLPARLEAPGLGSDGREARAANPFEAPANGVPGSPQSTTASPFAALAADIPADPTLTAADSTALTYSVARRVAMMNDVVKSNVVAALSTTANGNSTPIDFSTGASPLLSLYEQYGTGLLGTTGLASLANSQVPVADGPKSPPAPPASQSELPAPASGAERGSFETDHPGA
ncbi:MAG: hypothetical protein U0V73_01595 [Acidimicrobiia bacterium]